MKMIYKIARAELQTLFYSPIAWLILIIFTIQASMALCNVFEWQITYKSLGYDLSNLSMKMFADRHRGLFMVVQQYLYLYIPLLTMGLMSRELSSGSIKLLYSSPVTNTQIILGKYLSMIFYALVITSILLIFMIFSSFTIGNFDFIGVSAGLLGLFLLICAYAAIGLFMSSLTSYQVVAAIGSLAVLSVLNMIGSMWQDIAFVRDIAYWLSIRGRSSEFINGMIGSEDVLYFLVVISLFLSLSILRLKAIRQKTSLSVSLSRYISVSFIAILLGYVSSRPVMMFYFDATRTNQNTLTPNSQKIVAKMKGDLTINTYVNILDKYYYLGLPKGELRDIESFKQYLRFKPDIKMKYIRYYDKVNNPSLVKRYPGLSDRERMLEYAKTFKLDSNLFKTPTEIRAMENLLPEGNRFVRTLVKESGEKTFLRVFDDMQVTPSEAEITAAFKRLVMDLPEIGFVKGHGERECIKAGDRDYSIFAQERTFRYSLINQGFDYAEVNLDNEVPETVNILVIADVKSDLSPIQQSNLNKFIAKGGNLLIAGEPERQSFMNPLIAQFGVEFLPGRLVKPSVNFSPDFIMAKPTPEGAEMMYLLNEMLKKDYITTMPGTTGLKYSEDKGYKVTRLFVTDTTGTWNELETTAFADDSVRMNSTAGEELMSVVPTALSLSRKVGEKEQKIVILGDADCISNAEISISRKDVSAANYYLIMGAFFWMSDNEVPIDVRRPSPPDTTLSMDISDVTTTRWIFIGLFPLAMIIFYILLWIRRKGR
ncbi:MAG: ABC transporter [Bacteroidetes bacterium GWF2_40_14]|nr:MAG: ABC transporter [Bacteroidetes bacterium GWF2_40_14]